MDFYVGQQCKHCVRDRSGAKRSEPARNVARAEPRIARPREAGERPKTKFDVAGKNQYFIKMIYAYIRVSTDRQTVENQRFEIERFCEVAKIRVDQWVEETVSGTKNYSERNLGGLLQSVGDGDLIICSEISRLGRSLFMIMEILSKCMERGCRLWTVKDNYRLGNDIQSKVLAFAFGLSAEIERNLISQRTREALQRKKSEGKKLGRPRGRRNRRHRLDFCSEHVELLFSLGMSTAGVARALGVNPLTVRRFLLKKNG